MSYQQPTGWLVLDNSGSMTPYGDLARHVVAGIKDEFRDSGVTLYDWTTGSSGGLRYGLSATTGDGGGDGTGHIFDQLGNLQLAHRPAMPVPAFIIYVTDDSPNLSGFIDQVIANKMLVVDITSPFMSGPTSLSDKVQAIYDCILHDGDCPDIEECSCLGACDCFDDEDECEFSEWHQPFRRQPFFPGWNPWSDQASATVQMQFSSNKQAFIKGFADALNYSKIRYFDEISKTTTSPESILGPYRHPVDSDLNEINCAIDQCIGKNLQERATLACRLNDKIKRLVGGNTLTPAQHIRIKATKYRIYTHLLDMPHEAVVKSIYETDSIATTPTEVQEGHPMSARITTTVSLQTARQERATIADFKSLIAEVERVGGTDESYVDLDVLHRTARFDAVVVTAVAVEVTEPTLDPQVECLLSIQDHAKRVSALVDLLQSTRNPLVREQIKQVLMADTIREYEAERAQRKAAKTTAARKTTQAKA